jgi:hypothetical protein
MEPQEGRQEEGQLDAVRALPHHPVPRDVGVAVAAGVAGQRLRRSFVPEVDLVVAAVRGVPDLRLRGFEVSQKRGAGAALLYR